MRELLLRETDRSPLAARPLLCLAAGAGLLTGIGTLAVQLAGRFVLGRVVSYHNQLVWTTPLANVLVFLVVGVVLLAMGVVWRRCRSADVVLAVLVALSAYTLSLLYPRLHFLAMLLLGAGIGMQLGRMLASRTAWLRRLELPLKILVAAIAILGLTVNAVLWSRERAGESRLGSVPEGAPNVLLIIWDTVRAASLSLYGYARNTSPVLDSLAADAIVFDRAVAAAPWTLTSHGSLFTGYYPFDLVADWVVPLGDEHTTIAEAMAAGGYRTGGFVGNRAYSSRLWGLDRGFMHYESHPELTVGSILDSAPLFRHLRRLGNRWLGTYWIAGEREAPDIARRFLRWQARDTARPFFAFLNLFDAHSPYTSPAPFDQMFGAPKLRGIIPDVRPTEDQIRDLRDAYDGSIAFLDQQLGVLLEELRRRGVLDNTVVIVTSDHGEHFGEHGLLDHGNSLYMPLLHVPLVIMLPESAAWGQRVTAAVSLRDIPATLVDLTGIRPQQPFPGASLARYWSATGEPAARPEPIPAVVTFARNQPEWYPLARGEMRSVLLWPHHYILNGDGTEELYDLGADPGEMRNLAPVDTIRLGLMRAELARFPARTKRLREASPN
jgi:arylsulfatase A-like enzyme